MTSVKTNPSFGPFEIEQKFPVTDVPLVESRLAAYGIELGTPIVQEDQYFAHPCRSFAETDEAFRMRSIGEKVLITYKGPRHDAEAKTRREIELLISPDGGPTAAANFSSLVQALGFTPVSRVRKSRRSAKLDFEGRHLEIVRDDVDGLGPFVEIETTIPAIAEGASDTVDSVLAQAVAAVVRLATQLGLEKPERRSYLEMLLELQKKGQ